jgi:hypothetical protein
MVCGVLSWKVIDPKYPKWELEAACITHEEAERMVAEFRHIDAMDEHRYHAVAYKIVELNNLPKN